MAARDERSRLYVVETRWESGDINIIAIGKLKEKYWQDAVREYSKRLGSYCSLQIIELKESPLRANPSAADEQAVKEAEGQEILRRIRREDYVITLEIKGKGMSSEQLADEDRAAGAEREEHGGFRDRRISGAVGGGQPAGGPEAVLFGHDLPPSDDAGHPAGADLPQLQDHPRRDLS